MRWRALRQSWAFQTRFVASATLELLLIILALLLFFFSADEAAGSGAAVALPERVPLEGAK